MINLSNRLLEDRSNRAAFINNPLRQLSFDDFPCISLPEVKNRKFLMITAELFLYSFVLICNR